MAGLTRLSAASGDTAGPQIALQSEIGGVLEDGRAVFGRIAGASLSPDGSRLSVLDSERCQIVVFVRQGDDFRRTSRIQGCDGSETFLRPAHLIDDGMNVWVWDVGRSRLMAFSPTGELKADDYVVPPSGSGAQYYPAKIHFTTVGSEGLARPVLQWEVVLFPDADSYPQVLLSLPDGRSPAWLAGITAGATMPGHRSDLRPFSHGIEICLSPGREQGFFVARGTEQIRVLDKSSAGVAACWDISLEPGEGVNLNSTQVGCLRDLIMIRTRVYDDSRSEFTSGRDHYFGYDGEPLGSRRMKSEYGIRELGKVLDARGSLFVTASNLRFSHPTVFVWRVFKSPGAFSPPNGGSERGGA